jgi:hypothetical protein
MLHCLGNSRLIAELRALAQLAPPAENAPLHCKRISERLRQAAADRDLIAVLPNLTTASRPGTGFGRGRFAYFRGRDRGRSIARNSRPWRDYRRRHDAVGAGVAVFVQPADFYSSNLTVGGGLWNQPSAMVFEQSAIASRGRRGLRFRTISAGFGVRSPPPQHAAENHSRGADMFRFLESRHRPTIRQPPKQATGENGGGN